MKATTKTNTIITVRFNEVTGKVNGNDYKKLCISNFEVYYDGDGFTEFKVEGRIIRKYYPTWLKSGYAVVVL